MTKDAQLFQFKQIFVKQFFKMFNQAYIAA